MALDALDASALQGSLVVQKQITGEVMVTSDPVVILDNNKPKLVATGTSNIKKIIATSNIRGLVRSRVITVIL